MLNRRVNGEGTDVEKQKEGESVTHDGQKRKNKHKR